jgi:Rrf2 family iron-sulfur cluster assembly transcriptional regulator
VIPLTRSAEYAIRAMTYMARAQDPAEFVLVRDMSRSIGVPAPFLGKCLQHLVASGLLKSQRGRNGGFRLTRAPTSISLYEIIDAEEELQRTQRCLLGQAECSDERACPMHTFWKGASEDFIERLDRTTLADVVAFCAQNPKSEYPARKTR